MMKKAETSFGKKGRDRKKNKTENLRKLCGGIALIALSMWLMSAASPRGLGIGMYEGTAPWYAFYAVCIWALLEGINMVCAVARHRLESYSRCLRCRRLRENRATKRGEEILCNSNGKDKQKRGVNVD